MNPAGPCGADRPDSGPALAARPRSMRGQRMLLLVELDCATGALRLAGSGPSLPSLATPLDPDLIQRLAAGYGADEAQARLVAGQRLGRSDSVAQGDGVIAGGSSTGDVEPGLPEPDQGLFERARDELRDGERLRRSRRRGEARPHLRIALGLFKRLDESSWADRARTELLAAGERPGRAGMSDEHDLLTVQEQRIAALVAEGASNKEIAGRLDVSHKTIEFHLGNVYRKLGIPSRARLAALAATTSIGEVA